MKNSTTTDKRQNPRRLIIQGEDRKQKHEQIWDYLQSRCCINHPCVQHSTDLIYIDSFIIPLSQPCQLVFVPQGGIKVFLSLGHG